MLNRRKLYARTLKCGHVHVLDNLFITAHLGRVNICSWLVRKEFWYVNRVKKCRCSVFASRDFKFLKFSDAWTMFVYCDPKGWIENWALTHFWKSPFEQSMKFSFFSLDESGHDFRLMFFSFGFRSHSFTSWKLDIGLHFYILYLWLLYPRTCNWKFHSNEFCFFSSTLQVTCKKYSVFFR